MEKASPASIEVLVEMNWASGAAKPLMG